MTLLQAVLTVAFGALAGGVTNTVAIWMLFHPYEAPRLGRRRLRFLQGAIPKNRERLAAAMGRTVGERLLTGDDLARALAEPGFRAAFDERLEAFLRSALEKERGALTEELPGTMLPALRSVLDEVVEAALRRLDEYLASDAFRAAAERWTAQLFDEIRDRPISEVLTRDRERALTATAEQWIAEAVGGSGFERAVTDYLDRASHRLLRPDRTFQDLIPEGLAGAVEKAIAGYLPLALERLARLLEDPDAREKLRSVLHSLLDRFLQDLNFYKRVVASLVIPRDTVDRVIHAMETEGATQLSDLLHDDVVRDAMARSVNDAVVDLLRRPVAEVLGRPGDPGVDQMKETVAGWVLGVARDPQTSAFLVEKLRGALGAAEDRTWGDLLGRVGPDRVADALVAVARSEEAGKVYRAAADRVVGRALERPVGRPADFLGEDAARRVGGMVREPLWKWVQEQVPSLARRVDVAGRVERKILEFPMHKVEELVRGVTERELKLIIYLGYALGAFIGTALVAVQAVTG
ncbi:MAG TPA: DUF445 family protein [Longimicrobiales bacterium]|nr:DUF445 family protein [Longimicrobiales bacterium]